MKEIGKLFGRVCVFACVGVCVFISTFINANANVQINAKDSAQQPLVFEITSRDGKLTPSRIEVPVGRKIKLILINAGKGALEFEHPDLHIEKVLAPGARSFVVIHQLREGRYRFIDEYHPDTAYCEIIAK